MNLLASKLRCISFPAIESTATASPFHATDGEPGRGIATEMEQETITPAPEQQ